MAHKIRSMIGNVKFMARELEPEELKELGQRLCVLGKWCTDTAEKKEEAPEVVLTINGYDGTVLYCRSSRDAIRTDD